MAVRQTDVRHASRCIKRADTCRLQPLRLRPGCPPRAGRSNRLASCGFRSKTHRLGRRPDSISAVSHCVCLWARVRTPVSPIGLQTEGRAQIQSVCYAVRYEPMIGTQLTEIALDSSIGAGQVLRPYCLSPCGAAAVANHSETPRLIMRRWDEQSDSKL